MQSSQAIQNSNIGRNYYNQAQSQQLNNEVAQKNAKVREQVFKIKKSLKRNDLPKDKQSITNIKQIGNIYERILDTNNEEEKDYLRNEVDIRVQEERFNRAKDALVKKKKLGIIALTIGGIAVVAGIFGLVVPTESETINAIVDGVSTVVTTAGGIITIANAVDLKNTSNKKQKLIKDKRKFDNETAGLML
jgi:hypothetical protein